MSRNTENTLWAIALIVVWAALCSAPAWMPMLRG